MDVARRTLNELHPKAIDLLQPEFSVQRDGEQRSTISVAFRCIRCRMTACSVARHEQERHRPVKANTPTSRTLNEAAEESASTLVPAASRAPAGGPLFWTRPPHNTALKLDDAKEAPAGV
jgi:hypothetical protein